jgi:hypothetical protein
MTPSEKLLQAKLEQLEAGVPLEDCLADLSQEQAELLKLVVALREAPYPYRNPDITTAQRAQFLRQMSPVNEKRSQASRPAQAGTWSLQNWLRPRTVLAGAAAIISVCALIVLVAVGAFRSASRDGKVAENPPSPPTLEERIARQPFRTSTSGGSSAESPLPEPTSEAPIAQKTPSETPSESAHTLLMPIVSAPGVHDPAIAALREPQGLVEVQTQDGAWKRVSSGGLATAGQRVRTSELSSVLLAFNDGSETRLGPNTEISIEELNAHPSDGPRIVVLTQSIGETDHQVAPVTGYNSRYEVHTPSATGTAKGTAFQVRVTHGRLTRFSVDEGAVAVTGRNGKVDVLARQATLVTADGTLEDPAFRITGEGEVTQTGPTWIIAGLAFETHDETVIVGNPQVGDWVYVDGRLFADGARVADLIALLRRSPANRFTITGRVEAMKEDEWTIAGQAIQVDEETDVDAEIELQDRVRVEGIILQDGVLLAEQIRLIEETPGLPFSFTGVVQEIISDTWKISGVVITVDDETRVDEGLEVGDVVDVRGWILEDGSWLARAIERAEDVERSFEFTGEVESVDPWQVAGIPFETRTWTEIEPGIEVGDLVRVKGRILEDGTWVAFTIERLDDDEEDDELQIIFVGPVDGIDPWVVSGIPLSIDDDTVIDEDISVGDLVRVTVRILSDGSWLATRIERLELDGGGQGCVYITAVVKEVGPGWVLPENWSIIDLDGVSVEGEIQVGSVILMLVCVAEDGSIDVVSIVVIYQPPPATPPTPTPGAQPPPPPPPGHDEDAKVHICHNPNSKNPHTITVSRSAVQAHLDHGDTLGPCK